MDGKMQTSHTINSNGGQQFNAEEMHLSLLPGDKQNEIFLQKLEPKIRAKKAADATMERARKAVVATQMANSMAENEA